MKALKKMILESMIMLVSEGETIASGNSYNFSEFASENNYPLEIVKDVYYENEDMLTDLYQEAIKR